MIPNSVGWHTLPALGGTGLRKCFEIVPRLYYLFAGLHSVKEEKVYFRVPGKLGGLDQLVGLV